MIFAFRRLAVVTKMSDSLKIIIITISASGYAAIQLTDSLWNYVLPIAVILLVFALIWALIKK